MKVLIAYRDRARKRFLAKTEADGDCLRWVGSFDGDGEYGVFYLRPKQTTASRASFLLFNGPLEDYQQACHTCDHTWCVEPKHLFAGTQSENEADKKAKGRSNHGSARYNAKLSEDNVVQLRAQAKAGASHGQLSKQFGIARPNVGRIIRREIWAHVA